VPASSPAASGSAEKPRQSTSPARLARLKPPVAGRAFGTAETEER
jgi:hypothetical protein